MGWVKRLWRSAAVLLVVVSAATVCILGPGPPPARAAVSPYPGYVVETGCAASSDTSAWETDSNGGSFGLVAECPPTNSGILSSYPNGLSLGGGSASDGQYASWYTSVPAGIVISTVTVNSYYARDLTAGEWAGDWRVGGQTVSLGNTTDLPGGLGSAIFGSGGSNPSATGSLFGWSIQCRSSSGCSNNGDLIQVGQVTVQAQEQQGPTMGTPAGSLWQAAGYVWGDWTVSATGDGPSGVCTLTASLDGQTLPGTVNNTPNEAVWDQCGVASFSQMVDIANGAYGEGPVPLVFTDSDAADLGGPMEKMVDIDDTRPGSRCPARPMLLRLRVPST